MRTQYAQPSTTRRRQRGIALVLTSLLIVFLMAFVGLAIDASLAYAAKARLSAAADAAAIAAARSLNLGLTMAEQEASAIARARAFFAANFPDGHLMTRGLDVDVSVAETAYRTRTVSVSASVNSPAMFMRVLGFDGMTIQAEGRASRRDVNLIIVLDRSGSLQQTDSCEPMKAAARNFVRQFAPGRDRLGLIVFQTGVYRAFAPSMNFRSGSPNLESLISNIRCAGNTSLAQGLSMGYQELRDLAEPGALNLIVLFTDGLANGLVADFPMRYTSDVRYGDGSGSYSSNSRTYDMLPSPCQWVNPPVHPTEPQSFDENHLGKKFSAPWNPAWVPIAQVATKRGVLTRSGVGSTGNTSGLYQESFSSVSTTSSIPIITDNQGCGFSNAARVRRDIAYIPDQDAFGNATDCCRYNMGTERFTSGPYTGRIRPDKPSAVLKAGANALDSAGRRIRQDDQYNVVVYTIGLGDFDANEPPDETLMRRVSNDPSSPIYDSSRPEGLYVFAPNNTQLNQAFARVASEILRIAK
ncbi:MAG TPA: VWA domain-containing protein [Bryobacteraceae bacterium]|nr:VWA domain-containing protein [Bryobacteraceae bacterium]